MVVLCFHHPVYYDNSTVVNICCFFVVVRVYSLLVFVLVRIVKNEGILGFKGRKLFVLLLVCELYGRVTRGGLG